jgi:hypothetical protein
MRQLFHLVCITLLAVGCPLVASEFFVAPDGDDMSAGDSRTNCWATIQHAVDSVGPGDTITVLAGRYVGARIRVSGTESAPITLRGAPGEPVIIDAVSSEAWHNCIIELDNGLGSPLGHWVLEGFTVTNSPRYGIAVFGLDAERKHHITIRRNVVKGNTSTGVFFALSDHVAVIENAISENGEHGIYCSDSSRWAVVRDNHLHHNAASGLHCNGGYGLGGDGIIHEITVERNKIHHNGLLGGSAINMDGVDGAYVVNNLIHSDHASGISLFKGDGYVATRNVLIVHNTIDLAEDGRWALNITDTEAVNNRAYNNILYTRHPWRGSIAVTDPVPEGFASDYNIVMNRFSADGGATRIDFVAWQEKGLDPHSLIATPAELFVGPMGQDYRLRPASPAVDKGSSAHSVPSDINRLRRPFGSGPDIGAYEWVREGFNLVIAFEPTPMPHVRAAAYPSPPHPATIPLQARH